MLLWFRNPEHGGCLSVWASWGTALNEIILIALKPADEKLWAKTNICLPLVSSLILASVRCSKNTKYIGLVWIKAVQECRWTSDNDLFICWQKVLHFFHGTGSKVDQLEQDSTAPEKANTVLCMRKSVHEQRKGRSLGQTVGSLQLILALSVVQIWYGVLSSLQNQSCTFFHQEPWL